ncbi:MAG: hypothetical protein KGJ13_11760, partial [Patescibacteria group bacterium]|nr:hypothetical protein [Patescibacteria group bacterium]
LISDKDFGDAMSQIAFTVSHTLIDESGLRGPSDLIHAIDDPHGYGARYVRSELPSLTIPYSVGMGQMARAIDPYQRRVAGMLDAFRSKVPWWSEQNFPLRDWTGEPIPSREALGIDGLSAIYEERARNDPVEQAMIRLGIYPALPPKKIRGVEMSEQQYDDYARIAGKFAYQNLRLVVTPGFNRLPPDRQEQLIKSVLKQSRQYAEARVLSMDEAQSRALGQPSIIQRATAAKRAAIYGQPVAQ